MNELTENEIRMQEEIDGLRAEVQSLKTEIQSLKDFVKALYAMINDDDEEYDASDYLGGVEVGRFNT